MSKTKDLQAILAKAAGKDTPPPHPKEKAIKTKKMESQPEQKQPRNARRLVLFVSPAGYKELAMLGVEIDMTFQAMLLEAANDYLTKHRKNPIA